jgi:hypothetical protein
VDRTPRAMTIANAASVSSGELLDIDRVPVVEYDIDDDVGRDGIHAGGGNEDVCLCGWHGAESMDRRDELSGSVEVRGSGDFLTFSTIKLTAIYSGLAGALRTSESS